MRELKVVLILSITASIASCSSDADDILKVGGFSGLGAATDVAEHKGFLEAERITLDYHRVNSSEELMTNFVNGNFDLVQTNADHIVAWSSGQGIDGRTHDLAIVLGGYRGRQPLELVVADYIRSIADLKGKVLAVDAVHTGYSPILVYMLDQEGLVWKQDYELLAVGGGPLRIESMLKGETVGGLVVFNSELEQKGFHRLLSSEAHVTDYARAVTTARRDWAERNETLLVRYIRAMVSAINWLLDPNNQEEAIAIIMAADGVSAAEAREIYERSVDPKYGFIPDARIEALGIDQIIRIREVMGQMPMPRPSPDQYIEERYYQIATESQNR